MISKDDELLLNDPDYNLQLEKYYNPKIYNVLNDTNGTIKKVYSFSNERLDAVFKHFNFKDKRVLTVGSSGDQALAATLYGAKDITIIDSNIYTKAYTEYKIAAIKNLSFVEFKNSFTNERFNWKLYAKISHSLSEESKLFWDTIILNQDSPLDTYNNLVHVEHWKKPIICKMYKDENTYLLLKQKLENANFHYVYGEFSEFNSKSEGKYDVIVLSNIFKYVTKTEFDTFKDVVTNLYTNHLNEGGKIQIHYEYSNALGIPEDIFYKLFPNIKVNYAHIGEHFSYYLSKSKQKTKNTR